MRSFRSLGLSWILWDLIAFLRFRSVLDLESFEFLGVFQRENHFLKFERGLEIFFSISGFFSVSTVGLCFSSFSFYNSYFEVFLGDFSDSLDLHWDFWSSGNFFGRSFIKCLLKLFWFLFLNAFFSENIYNPALFINIKF